MASFNLSCSASPNTLCNPGDLNRWATKNNAFTGDGVTVDIKSLRRLRLAHLGNFNKSRIAHYLSRKFALVSWRSTVGRWRYVQVLNATREDYSSWISFADPFSLFTRTDNGNIHDEIQAFMAVPQRRNFI